MQIDENNGTRFLDKNISNRYFVIFLEVEISGSIGQKNKGCEKRIKVIFSRKL